MMTPVHVGKWAYWKQKTSCTHNESRLLCQHETITTSPNWPPGVKKIHWSAFFFLSLPRLIHPSVHNSFLFINLSSCSSVSWDGVCLSLVSQHHGGCVSRPDGIAPHNTWLQTLGTVKPHRLPLKLGKCRAQASSNLLNNQCVPMVTSACSVLAGKPV